jgi:hypothetical protein
MAEPSTPDAPDGNKSMNAATLVIWHGDPTCNDDFEFHAWTWVHVPDPVSLYSSCNIGTDHEDL